MEIKITKIETTKKEVSTRVGYRCDLCKEICNNPDGWSETACGDTKPNVQYINKFEAYAINSFPNFHCKTGVIIDFCPDCAAKVLIALRAMGVEINEFDEEL